MSTAIVVGAGVFGASVAHELAGRGWEVTLVERYQPGHVRASSGGESRIIRFSHGEDTWYTRSAWRARELWERLQEESGVEVMVTSGVMWFARRADGWEASSEETLREEGIPVERMTPGQAARIFPDLRTDDLAFVLHEPGAGVLHARRAVQALVGEAIRRGARLVSGRARPDGRAVWVDGDVLEADRVVWAPGPWLGRLFPELVRVRVSQQDVFFYGVGPEWATPPLPAWVDYDRAAYGLGDLDARGFKVGPDTEGPDFDPETGSRTPLPELERMARSVLADRFPSLADAPLVGTRTCQYTLTADTAFVVAPHPELEGVWLVGGGSGHGFKHGPALGEYVRRLLEGESGPEQRFRLGERPATTKLRTAGGGAPPGG